MTSTPMSTEGSVVDKEAVLAAALGPVAGPVDLPAGPRAACRPWAPRVAVPRPEAHP